jgi:hypothetical protein
MTPPIHLPMRPARAFPVLLTIHLPDGGESDPVELAPGTPVPDRGDTVILWDAAGQQERYALRVSERVFSYFPGPAGPWSCEVLLYTDSG